MLFLAPTLLLALQAPADVRAEAPVETIPAVSEAVPARRSGIRLAVYDFVVEGMEARVGRVVTDAVVAELRKLQRVSVIGMDEVRQMLDHEAQRQLAGCGDDSCLSDIADALGVDGLITGSIARLEGQSVLALRRIDQNEAKVLGTTSKRLEPAGGEELLAAVGPSVEELFPDIELRPGAKRGVDPELVLRLNPPPLPTWVFYGAAATTGAIAGGSAALLGAWGLLYADFDNYRSRASDEDIQGVELTAKAGAANTALLAVAATFGGAVVAAAITGVTALFTDWQGYASVEE